MRKEWLQDLGEQIAAARTKGRISQQDLADYVGITRGHMSNYERGHVKSPSANGLAKVVERFNCTLTLNGLSFGPQYLPPPEPAEKEPPPLQLELPFKTAQDAIRIFRAVQRGARLSIQRKRGRLVFRAINPSKGQSAQA